MPFTGLFNIMRGHKPQKRRSALPARGRQLEHFHDWLGVRELVARTAGFAVRGPSAAIIAIATYSSPAAPDPSCAQYHMVLGSAVLILSDRYVPFSEWLLRRPVNLAE